MKKEFYSNGKLLITGEYLVLDGAKSLAIPTKFGQSLSVETTSNFEKISWKSFDMDGHCWFETEINFDQIINFKYDSKIESINNTLLRILHEGFEMNSQFLQDKIIGYNVSTNLTFPRNWGLGTSSTLLNNIAQWLQVDGFELLNKSFGGSGYDIACAQNDSAITYQIIKEKPTVVPVALNWNFKENINFVYLNKKQSSKIAIANYRSKKTNLKEEIIKVSELTTSSISDSLCILDFKNIIKEHEDLISAIIEIPTVKSLFFSDFDGEIKSLGAWGGDFVMAVSEFNSTEYFKSKGYETIISYHDMIL